MPAYGVALEDYANNATGLMIAVGDFQDFDTSSYSVGDTLYVAVGGGMTNVKPTGTALIQNMGIVSRSNANNGDVEIVAIGRTNDVPNLPTGRLFVGTATNTSLISDVVYVDDANDRVGIGTASPQSKLHLATTGGSTLTIQNTTNSGNAALNFRDEGDNDQFQIYYALGANRSYNLVNGNGLTVYSSQSSSEIARFGNASSGYTDSYFTGDVGIGTTSPSQKLHVNAGTTNTVALFESTDATSRIVLKRQFRRRSCSCNR